MKLFLKHVYYKSIEEKKSLQIVVRNIRDLIYIKGNDVYNFDW